MIHELTKGEGLSFLQLLYLAIHADDMIYDTEEEAFAGYIKKLGFGMSMDEFGNTVLEDVLGQINTYEKRKKKIIFTEMLGVLFSDDVYDEEEKIFVIKVGTELGFSEEDILGMEEAVMDYIVAYGSLLEIINQK